MPATQQSPSDYDGPALGRDDPVWPYYLGESSQRDADLVDGWNKSMDVLLRTTRFTTVFAALFSAVVTAFLIESQKNLQPDAALITAAGVSRMVDLVEAIASSREPTPPSVLPTVDNFHPSQSDIVINTLWFFSLALSMSVALIAMLVKQWGDGYRRGDRFSPRYVQARTRQARYNGLKGWGAKFVVRLLPIIMHVALGLFLLGLLLSLKRLNLKLMWPVMAAVIATLGSYVVTTILPLFTTFCPYNTPLSSRTVWGCFYAIVNIITPSGEKWNTLPCERKERAQSTSMALDSLTAQAVVWLVSHSQAENAVEAAIRAIANANAGPEFWEYLIKDKLVTLMAQRFIAFFKGTLDRPESSLVDSIIHSEDLKRQVTLCTQALAKVAKHSTVQIIQDANPNSTIPEYAVKESGRIMLPEAYFIAVQSGLYRLTKCTTIPVAAAGFCGASAWCTSTGRMNRNDREQQPLLQALLIFLEKNSESSDIPRRLMTDLVETLAVETSHMIWELKNDDMNETLKAVIDLCLGPNLLEGSTRKAVSVGLAVTAALINDYQKILDSEIDQLSKGGGDNFGICGQYIKAHEAYALRYPYPPDSYLKCSRQWRAVWIAELCIKNPKYLDAHSDALLFLGLAGILRSFRMDSSQFIHVAELFIKQLKATRVKHSDKMSLPFVLVSSCDVQPQVAQDILAAFHNQLQESTDESEEVKIKLLECLVSHGQWIEFRPVFLVEILRMLKSSRGQGLRRQCVIALDSYWFMSSPLGVNVYNLPDWELFTDFNLIQVFVEVFVPTTPGSDEDIGTRSSAISCFAKLARTITLQQPSECPGLHAQAVPNQLAAQGAANQSSQQAVAGQSRGGQTAGDAANTVTNLPNVGNDSNHPPPRILEALKQLLVHNRELFSVFAREIACGTTPGINQTDLNFWRKAILSLPNEFTTSAATPQMSPTSSSHPAPLTTIPAAPASINSQVLPANTIPQASLNSTSSQNPIPSCSGPPAANSTSSQPPATDTSPQAQTHASTSIPPPIASSGSQPLPVSTPPMAPAEALNWLLEFAEENANKEGTLGQMATALRHTLGQTP